MTHVTLGWCLCSQDVQFQAGAFDPWGGLGFDQCAVLLNHEFERVFYKNLQSFGATILNFYMVRPAVFLLTSLGIEAL